MKLLVISIMALGLAITSADKLNPEDYPPPPPVPTASLKTTKPPVKITTTTVKTTVKPTTSKKVYKTSQPTVVKSLPPKPKLRKIVPKKKVPANLTLKKPLVPKKQKIKTVLQQAQKTIIQQAQRRDSSYGAPAAPKRQVIIKQAGPSKQYAWVGHGRYAPLNIPNPFPASLPKWVPMGNNIFEAGLLYPGKPGGSSKPAPPPPPPVKSEPSYSAPALPSYTPSASVDSYSAPKPAAPSYNAPAAPSYNAPAYSAPQPSYNAQPSYSPPSVAPVYNPQPTSAPAPLPAGIPAQPAYESLEPTYGSSSLLNTQNSYQSPPAAPAVTAVPAYTTAPPAYSTPVPSTAAPIYNNYQQPSYVSTSKPFTAFNAFGSTAQSSYSSPVQQQPSYNIPPVEVNYEPIGKPGNFPEFNSLPGFQGQAYVEPSPYEAQASYDSPKAVAPTQNSYNNAYDVALKVEETYGSPEEEDQDVYFIFYEEEEPREPVAAPSLKGYVSDATVPAPPQPPPTNNQFKPPSGDDVRTIYVPFENTVNVPDVFDVSVGSSFGYSGPPQSSSKVPTANGASSYDNPISSFDAPIYDENSYTADASTYDANTFSGPLWRENAGSLVRKVRRPGVVDTVDNTQSVKFSSSLATSNVPYGSRLSSRTPYDILGL